MDDDGDPLSRSHNRKIQSFSQPLGRDAAITAKRAAAPRKHSLDGSSDDLIVGYPNPNLPPLLPPAAAADGGSSLTLDLAMALFGGGSAPGTLPEFVGSGGGSGIFRVPVRAALHPGRPPAIELRPHPLRETQYGSFLRTIGCTDGEIWAGQENGVRFWKYEEVFDVWKGGMRMKRGDEESAPFKETRCGSPTLCLAVDKATGVVWSGHKDGKIRSWKIEERKKNMKPFSEEEEGGGGGEGEAEEGLSWQAHRTPVLSMVISSYGNNY